MAIKALLLEHKIRAKKQELEGLKEKETILQQRTANAELALNELNENSTAEERAAVENEVNAIDAEQQALHQNRSDIEKDIKDFEKELSEIEENQKRSVNPTNNSEQRKEKINMENRTNFYGMSIQERDAFFNDDGVKNFLSQVRTCIKEKRALNNAGLLIPQIMLDLIKPKIEETSKLLSKVNFRHVSGSGRARIMGIYPEAVWTEACAKLNELSLGFSDAEIDGYKVAGFFAVCNAILEDNDINLATELIEAISKAIGKAIDKAIVYGTGVKMPMGFVTRLAQTVKPETYSATAREWKDLHESNIITGKGSTGLNLFKEIVGNTKVIENDYSETGLVWIMNRKTHTDLIVNSVDKNMNAAIVAGMNNTMPVIGGDIIELPFIPDNNIAYGYLDAYLLGERAGTNITQSEHVRFLEDQTVFKGVARYDGMPLIAESFGVMTIDTSEPVTAVDFPQDTANA